MSDNRDELEQAVDELAATTTQEEDKAVEQAADELAAMAEQEDIDPQKFLDMLTELSEEAQTGLTGLRATIESAIRGASTAAQSTKDLAEKLSSLLITMAAQTTEVATKFYAWDAIIEAKKQQPKKMDALARIVTDLESYIDYLDDAEEAGENMGRFYLDLWYMAENLAEILPYIKKEAAAYKKETGKAVVTFQEFAEPDIDPETGVDNSRFARAVRALKEAKAASGIAEESSKKEAPHSYYLQPYSALPTSPAINFLLQTFNTGLKRQMEGSTKNRHESISYMQNGDTLAIMRENKRDRTVITVADAQAVFSGKSKSFTKIFCYTLQQMNSQFFPREVVIDLQEMVDLGMYSRPDAAARAMVRFYEQQKNTTISGKTYKRGSKDPIEEEGGQLFYHYKRRGTKFVLFVNENFNFDYLAQYYTTFPTFCYRLKNNAFALVEYIFYLARQNTATIKKTGGFTVSFESIRHHLGLPSLEEASKNRHYQQDIKDPIEAAIEEIEDVVADEAERTGDDNPAFTLTPIVDDDADITEWLGSKLEIKFNTQC